MLSLTLLVLVKLLQVVNRHGVDSTVLGTVKIVLVTQDLQHEQSAPALYFSFDLVCYVRRWPCSGEGCWAA